MATICLKTCSGTNAHWLRRIATSKNVIIPFPATFDALVLHHNTDVTMPQPRIRFHTMAPSRQPFKTKSVSTHPFGTGTCKLTEVTKRYFVAPSVSYSFQYALLLLNAL